MSYEACSCGNPSGAILICHPVKCADCKNYMDKNYVKFLNHSKVK